MHLARKTALLLVLVLAAACATTPPPGPLPERSIVAISVQTRSPIGIGKETNPGVYFVRLDAESELTSGTIFSSNYTLGDYVFLVNAPPGRYAAVAAQSVAMTEGSASTPVHQGSNTSVSVGVGFEVALGRTTYLPEQVIRQTIVEVPAGATVFMGDFEVGMNVGFGGADATQQYYREKIQPDQSSGIKVQSPFSVSAIYRGSPHGADRGSDATNRFLAKSREALTAGGWSVTPASVSAAPPGAQ